MFRRWSSLRGSCGEDDSKKESFSNRFRSHEKHVLLREQNAEEAHSDFSLSHVEQVETTRMMGKKSKKKWRRLPFFSRRKKSTLETSLSKQESQTTESERRLPMFSRRGMTMKMESPIEELETTESMMIQPEQIFCSKPIVTRTKQADDNGENGKALAKVMRLNQEKKLLSEFSGGKDTETSTCSTTGSRNSLSVSNGYSLGTISISFWDKGVLHNEILPKPQEEIPKEIKINMVDSSSGHHTDDKEIGKMVASTFVSTVENHLASPHHQILTNGCNCFAGETSAEEGASSKQTFHFDKKHDITTDDSDLSADGNFTNLTWKRSFADPIVQSHDLFQHVEQSLGSQQSNSLLADEASLSTRLSEFVGNKICSMNDIVTAELIKSDELEDLSASWYTSPEGEEKSTEEESSSVSTIRLFFNELLNFFEVESISSYSEKKQEIFPIKEVWIDPKRTAKARKDISHKTSNLSKDGSCVTAWSVFVGVPKSYTAKHGSMYCHGSQSTSSLSTITFKPIHSGNRWLACCG